MTPILVAGAALALAGDLLTKAVVRARIPEGGVVPLGGIRVRRLTHVGRRVAPWQLGVLAAGVLALDALTPVFSGWLAQAGLGLALGGAAGNVVDRARRGAVLDFVDLRVWPVFNLADAAIATGTAMALWAIVGP